MGQSRISFSKNYYGDLEASVHLASVSEAIRRSKASGGPAVVCGPHPLEEIQSYLRSVNSPFRSAFVAIGPRGADLGGILQSRYKGRVRVLRRISSFLQSHVLFTDENLAATIGRGELKWPDMGLVSYLTDQYVSSRKNPDGAIQEIDDYFSNMKSLEFHGPIVLRKYHYGWTAEQSLVAAMAVQQNLPLVFITNGDALAVSFANSIYTDPVSLGEVFSAINAEFKVPKDVIARNYRIWRSSKYRRNVQRRVALEEVAEIYPLGDFVTFLLEVVAEEEQYTDQSSSIPSRIVAPLMFRESGDAIGIDHTSVTGVSYQNAVGGVRALRSLTSDLRDSGVLLNAVAGITPCLNRIINLLDRIEQSPTIEESSIVEFGVEFSYLESRILNAQAKISRDTMEFVLAYTGEGQDLLERFEPWQTYRAEGGGSSENLGSSIVT